MFLTQPVKANEHYQADLALFESILKAQHPNLYAYTDKSEFDALFAHQFDADASYRDFFTHVLKIGSLIGDGHFMMQPNQGFLETLFTSKACIPLRMKILDGELHNATKDSPIPFGAKIIAINGRDTPDILRQIRQYIPSDAKNSTAQNRLIEEEFGTQFFLHSAPETRRFAITYVHDGERRTRTIAGDSPLPPNHSPRAPYRAEQISDDTYMLSVSQFIFEDQSRFEEFLDSFFQKMKRDKIAKLIIDVRDNPGGLRENSILLYSYLADAPFKQRKNAFVARYDIAFKDYVLNIPRAEFPELKVVLEDIYGNYTDPLAPLMRPNKNTFAGKVFVLIDAKTFSAGAEFALLAKNDARISLIGAEESAGNYYQHIGDIALDYFLPNTETVFTFSLASIEHYVRRQDVAKAAGITPDIWVTQSYGDFISGHDVVFERAKKIAAQSP